jgi:protein PhnA
MRAFIDRALSRIPVSTLPPCPNCNSEYTYEDGAQLICPECAHEWSAQGDSDAAGSDEVKKDSVGNVLQDGDTVTVIKDLKVKGSSPVRRRPRHRLQDRRHRRHEAQVRIRPQGLSPSARRS